MRADHVGKLEVMAGIVVAFALLTLDYGRPWLWLVLVSGLALLLARFAARRSAISKRHRTGQ